MACQWIFYTIGLCYFLIAEKNATTHLGLLFSLTARDLKYICEEVEKNYNLNNMNLFKCTWIKNKILKIKMLTMFCLTIPLKHIDIIYYSSAIGCQT